MNTDYIESIDYKTENDINNYIELRKYYREKASLNKNFGFNYDKSLFLKIIHTFLTPQSYGTRIQNKLIEDYDLIKVPSSIDKGDVKNDNDKYGEIKVSYKDINNNFHFVQIRKHQMCDFYLLVSIDTDDNYKTYSFVIDIDDIDKVLYEMKATNCHGVSKNKKDKSQQELRFSVNKNSDKWNYLINNFLVEEDYVKEYIINL